MTLLTELKESTFRFRKNGTVLFFQNKTVITLLDQRAFQTGGPT